LKILICDDEHSVFEEIKKHIQQYGIKNNLEFELLYCSTAEELLNTKFDYNILFLDIMLGDNDDGIDIGKKLRTAGNSALFVIVTSRSDRIHDGYSANVFRYLIKPICWDDICETLNAAIESLSYDRKVISAKFKHETRYIHIKDIVYVESYGRKQYIVTKTNKVQTSTDWHELMEQLSEHDVFFSPRSMCYVNLAHVTAQSKTEITMLGDERIRFARGRYHEFIIAFSKFIRVYI